MIKNQLRFKYLAEYDRYLIDDLTPFGTKQRVAKILVKEAVDQGINYLTYKMRFGLAATALAEECAKYNGKIKLVLFCSANKNGMLRDIYYPYITYPNIVSLRFYKNYGKGNLEKRMKDWCALYNGLALPGGFLGYGKNQLVFEDLSKTIIEFSGLKRLFCVSASGTLYKNLSKFFHSFVS